MYFPPNSRRTAAVRSAARIALAGPLIAVLVACGSKAKPAVTTAAAETTVAAAAPGGAETTVATPSGGETTAVASAGETTVAQSSDGSAPSASAATEATRAAGGTTGPAGANAIPKLPGEVGALKDVTVTSCAKAGADWSAKGTVKNPTGGAAAYVIAVSFLDEHNTTLGLGFTRVDGVPAAASQEWTVSSAASGDNLRCILRVTRANI